MSAKTVVVPYRSPLERAFGRTYRASVTAIATLLLTGILGIITSYVTGLVVDPKMVVAAVATLLVNTTLLGLAKWVSANADEASGS